MIQRISCKHDTIGFCPCSSPGWFCRCGHQRLPSWLAPLYRCQRGTCTWTFHFFRCQTHYHCQIWFHEFCSLRNIRNVPVVMMQVKSNFKYLSKTISYFRPLTVTPFWPMELVLSQLPRILFTWSGDQYICVHVNAYLYNIYNDRYYLSSRRIHVF